MPAGAIVEWDSETSAPIVAHNNRKYGLVTFKGLTGEAKKLGQRTSLKEGEQYWILVDTDPATGKENIAPYHADWSSWWAHFQRPSKESMEFNSVVCPKPFPINVGDSVGHLGYYEDPTENMDTGYEARYQVHIECLSMDDNLPNFLENPEHLGKTEKEDKKGYKTTSPVM